MTTNPSPGGKKKKFTIIASLQGVERAEKALIRLGFDTKSNFAQSKRLARNTVTKFFQREPIQLDSFKKICQELGLNWRDIAEIKEEEQSNQLGIQNCTISNVNEDLEPVQTLRRQVIIRDRQSRKSKSVITLEGDIDSVQNLKIIELILRENSGSTIEITDIKKGSIKLFIEGSPKDIERLVSRIRLGILTVIDGFPVEDIQILSEGSKNNELDDKWHLVREIISQPVKGRKLSGVDLSDADLSSADLSSADLSSADLSSTDLSSTDLSSADLSDADLSSAILSGANLSGANLSGANLSGANLSGANLSYTIIDSSTKLDAKWHLVKDIVTQGAEGRNLSGAELSDANLRSANLRSVNLRSANLRSANLSGANLSGANLNGANLSGAYLNGANLSGAYLNGTNLSGAYLNGANLNGTNLNGANLSGAIINDAYLNGADLSRANLSDANLRRADLRRADLRRADLRRADLRRADLSRADLIGANVENARFRDSLGISESMKRDLIQRGAIFEDSPGDRSAIYSPAPSRR